MRRLRTTEPAPRCAGRLGVAAKLGTRTGTPWLAITCDACGFRFTGDADSITLDELAALQVRHDREAMPDVLELAYAWQQTPEGDQLEWDDLLAEALEYVMKHRAEGSEQ